MESPSWRRLDAPATSSFGRRRILRVVMRGAARAGGSTTSHGLRLGGVGPEGHDFAVTRSRIYDMVYGPAQVRPLAPLTIGSSR